MKSTWNKLGIWALISVMGVSLLNACGDGENDADTATTDQQLAELKEGEDIWTILGRSNGNRICGKNMRIDTCTSGKNSGGLRFKGGISLSGGRSGCEWRGEESVKKCRVACDRITSKSLCVGGLITTKSKGCEWRQSGDEQGKCMNLLMATGSNLIDSANQAARGKKIYDIKSLGEEDYTCITSTFCKITPGCILRGSDTDKKCRTSCDRIKIEKICETNADGCDWISNSCK